jgi:peptide deformylase
MPILTILEFPDPRLRTIAKPVTRFDEKLARLIDDMFETMYEAPGIGLAATQVNVHQQLVVIDVTEEKNCPLVFINPRITVLGEEMQSYNEGCLSVPGFHEPVTRPKRVRVDALNAKGAPFSMEDDSLLAVCIQHEVDHLNGKLFVDYLSTLKRSRIRSKLEKNQRSHTL